MSSQLKAGYSSESSVPFLEAEAFFPRRPLWHYPFIYSYFPPPVSPAGSHQSRFPLLSSPLIVCIAASSKSFGPSTSYKLKLACHVSLRAMYLVVGLSRLRDGLCFVFPQSERCSLCHSGPPEWTSKHVSTSDSRPRAVYGSRIKLFLLFVKCDLDSERPPGRVLYAADTELILSHIRTHGNIWPSSKKKQTNKTRKPLRVHVWHFCLRFSITSWTWLAFSPRCGLPTRCFREILCLIGFVLSTISPRTRSGGKNSRLSPEKEWFIIAWV